MRRISLLAVFVSLGAPAADWPEWRGPNRDGVIENFQGPAAWPGELNRKWQITVGEGHSSPVVDEGRVYQFARQGQDEVILCLDPADGKVIWEHSYPAPYEVRPAARAHGKGPKSTPIVAGGRVCTLGISGILTCLDADSGDLLWRKEFSGEFASTSPRFGTAMSPMMADGALIAHVGGHDSGALRAFDPATGETKWSWDGDGPAYPSPVILEFGGKRQLVTQSQQKTIGLSPSNGELLWEMPFETPYVQNVVTPVLYRSTLIISGLSNPTQGLHDSAGKPNSVWENMDASMYMSSPVLAGNLLFGFTNRNKGQLFCLDPATGRIRWTGPPRSGDNAALLVAGEHLLALTTDGVLTVARISSDRLDVVRRYAVADSPTWAHPAPLDDGLLIKDETTLALWSW